MQYSLEVIQTLALVGGAHVNNQKIVSLSDTLEFVDELSTKAIYQSISDRLTFRQYNPGAAPHQLSYYDNISFHQSFSRSYIFKFADTLFFTQHLDRYAKSTIIDNIPIYSISHTLLFSDYGWATKATHSLSF